MPDQGCFVFAEYRLDIEERSLVRAGQGSIPLPPKVFDLLVVLVRNSGHLLTREELLQAVWPDSFVEENNLTVNISLLRKVLGSTADGRAFIETVPKRGYRFLTGVVQQGQRCVPDAREPADELTPAIPAAAHAVPLLETRSPALPLFESAAHPPAPPDRRRLSARGLWGWSLGVLLLVLAGAAGGLLLLGRHRSPPAAAAGARMPLSLAVMPFRNLRQDPGTDYLGFALADSLINKLAYVSELSVRPSYTVARYAAEPVDPRRVATELAVDTLLTGTYLKDGETLRISTQLIEPRTERMVWHDTVDVRFDDLLATSDNLAQAVVAGLALHPSAPEAAHLLSPHTVDPQAYESYLRGVDLYSSGHYRAAIETLERAEQTDGNFAPIAAMLGRAYTTDASLEFGGEPGYRKALEAYQRALTLDPSLLACRVYMANLFTDTGRVESAVPLLREALALNPNFAEAEWELSYAYRFGGLLDRSIELAERARSLDPAVKRNSSVINAYLYTGQYARFLASLPEPGDNAFLLFYRGFGKYHLHDEAAARSDFERAFQLNPTLLQTEVGEALALGLRHDAAHGLALLRHTEKQIETLGVRDPEALYKVAEAYAALGDEVSALRVLEASIDRGFFPYPYFVADPLLRPVRGQPRFAEVLVKARERYEQFGRSVSGSAGA